MSAGVDLLLLQLWLCNHGCLTAGAVTQVCLVLQCVLSVVNVCGAWIAMRIGIRFVSGGGGRCWIGIVTRWMWTKWDLLFAGGHAPDGTC